jgi:hypothetical protein
LFLWPFHIFVSMGKLREMVNRKSLLGNIIVKVLLYERIKSLLLIFCGKIFSQNSLTPIKIFNSFLNFYDASWTVPVWARKKSRDRDTER